MASEFDASEFVDDDLQEARRKAPGTGVASAAAEREGQLPSPEDVEAKVGEMQHKLSELKRAQQELERERASLEELRRRQSEFTTGREEMLQNLTRGIGLLEEAQFAAQRDLEQLNKALGGLKEALQKIESIREEAWTKENLQVELTRASTTIENARMEWNAARLKFAVLVGKATGEAEEEMAPPGENPFREMVRERSYAEVCKIGLALTWPVALAGLAIFLALILRG